MGKSTYVLYNGNIRFFQLMYVFVSVLKTYFSCCLVALFVTLRSRPFCESLYIKVNNFFFLLSHRLNILASLCNSVLDIISLKAVSHGTIK